MTEKKVAKPSLVRGRATDWVADESTTTCCYCNKRFNQVIRRHHCRRCGLLFCQSCSSRSEQLLWYGFYEKVRVCNNCHTLAGRENEFERTLLPLLAGPTPLEKSSGLTKDMVMVSFNVDTLMFEWRNPRLQKNEQQGEPEALHLAEIANILQPSDRSFDIQTQTSTHRFYVDVQSHSGDWVKALSEAVELFIKIPERSGYTPSKQPADNNSRGRPEQGSGEPKRVGHSDTYENIREKYKKAGSDSASASASATTKVA